MRAVDTAARRDHPTKAASGLNPEGVAEISKALTAILADMFALYVKTKNFHWHMSGAVCTKLEIWLLVCMEAIVIRLVRRQWIGRANAAMRLKAIDVRLAKIAQRDWRP